MVNFGVTCYGLLNLSKVCGLPREFLKSAALVCKDMKVSAGACNSSVFGMDPARLKGIKKSLDLRNAFCKAQSRSVWVK